MPTASLTALMDEIAATLETALGSDVSQVVARRWFKPTPPAIDIYPASPFRTTVGAGFGEVSGAYVFIVRARVNPTDEIGQQDVLISMMDDEHSMCVALALQDDQTLNGLASSVQVDGPSDFGMHDDGAGAFLGVLWTVTVLRQLS